MSDQDVNAEQLDRVKIVMAATFEADMSDVSASTPPSLVPGWDSVSVTVLVLALEDEFQIEMPLDQVFEVATVGGLVRLIAARTSVR